jgi:hypothetical protein
MPPESKTPPKPARAPKFKVVAVADGYYDNKLRRTGDVFFIDGTLPTADQIKRKDGTVRDPKLPLMLGKWMRPAPADAQPHITSSNEVIRRENAATAASRAEGGTVPPGDHDDDPLGAGGD